MVIKVRIQVVDIVNDDNCDIPGDTKFIGVVYDNMQIAKRRLKIKSLNTHNDKDNVTWIMGNYRFRVAPLHLQFEFTPKLPWRRLSAKKYTRRKIIQLKL
jgi:hypothetical protein